MSFNKAWAEALPRETLQKFIEVGDGHTLFDPETYIEIGVPKEVVDHYTRTHVSPKRPHAGAVDSLSDALRTVARTYLTQQDEQIDPDEPWSVQTFMGHLLNEDDDWFSSEFASLLLEKMIDAGVDSVYGYHPKESMWDNQGNVIESLEAVYGLEITRGLCTSLSLEYDGKIGRGSQYDAYCKAIREYLDGREVS